MLTLDDISALETEFKVSLPQAYRRVLVQYPFGDDSDGPDLICNDLEDLRQLNQCYEPPAVGKPFFISSAMGEEAFFIDASAPEAPVYEYQIDSGSHKLLHPRIADFVQFIQELDARKQEDPVEISYRVQYGDGSLSEPIRLGKPIKISKPWWKFW